MSVLNRILTSKREEIAKGITETPQHDLLARARDCAPARGFLRTLNNPPKGVSIALIAEIKRASPSKGLIRKDFVPADLAKAYENGGAACLSVLTDQQYFQGQNSFLDEARTASTLPVLRKDFIIDPWQVAQSRVMGADCILLIMAALQTTQASALAGQAKDLGMDVLVEVHNAKEMHAALTLPTSLIGINNRNLSTFETSLGMTEVLAVHAPTTSFLVSESGIGTPDDIARVKSAGARAVLVGESLMRQDDVEAATRRLLGQPT